MLEPKEEEGSEKKVIEVLPGREEIVVLRVKNSKVKEIKFPPPIDLKVVDLKDEDFRK